MTALLLQGRLAYGLQAERIIEGPTYAYFSTEKIPEYQFLETRDGAYEPSPELLAALDRHDYVFIHGGQEKLLLDLIRRLLLRVYPTEPRPLELAREALLRAWRYSRTPLNNLTFGLAPVEGLNNLRPSGPEELPAILKRLPGNPESLHLFHPEPSFIKSLVCQLLEAVGLKAAYWKVELGWAASALPETATAWLLDGRLGFGFRPPADKEQHAYDLAVATKAEYQKAFAGGQKIFLYCSHLFPFADELLSLLLSTDLESDEAQSLILSALETARWPMPRPPTTTFSVQLAFLDGQLFLQDQLPPTGNFLPPSADRHMEIMDQLQAGRKVYFCTRWQVQETLLLAENIVRRLRPGFNFDWPILARRLDCEKYTFHEIPLQASEKLWQLRVLPNLLLGCGLGPERRVQGGPEVYQACLRHLKTGQPVEVEVNSQSQGFALALALYAGVRNLAPSEVYRRFEAALVTGQYPGYVPE